MSAKCEMRVSCPASSCRCCKRPDTVITRRNPSLLLEVYARGKLSTPNSFSKCFLEVFEAIAQ